MKIGEGKDVYVTCLNCSGSVYLTEGYNCKKCRHEVTKAQRAYFESFSKK